MVSRDGGGVPSEMERLSGEEHSSLHLESDDVRLGGDSEHDGVALLDRGDGRLHAHRWPLQLLRSQNGELDNEENKE